jgi:hypothetical protein
MMVMMTAMTPSEKASRRDVEVTWWVMGLFAGCFGLEQETGSRIHGAQDAREGAYFCAGVKLVTMTPEVSKWVT